MYKTNQSQQYNRDKNTNIKQTNSGETDMNVMFIFNFIREIRKIRYVGQSLQGHFLFAINLFDF